MTFFHEDRAYEQIRETICIKKPCHLKHSSRIYWGNQTVLLLWTDTGRDVDAFVCKYETSSQLLILKLDMNQGVTFFNKYDNSLTYLSTLNNGVDHNLF